MNCNNKPVFLLLLSFSILSCKKNQENTTTVISDTTIVPETDIATSAPKRAQYIAVDLGDDEEILKLFKTIYPDDSIIQMTDGQKGIDVKITSWDVVYEGNLFTSSGNCNAFKVLRIDKQEVMGGTSTLEWMIATNNDTKFSSPLSVDVTEYQSEHTVSMSFNDELAECSVAAIEEATSGGDIDLNQSKYITFYSVDEDGFNEIITLALEEKMVRDYFAEGAEPVTEVNTRKDYTILESVSNGLHDIQIITSNPNDEGDTMDSDGETCKWNGNSYECTPMMVD